MMNREQMGEDYLEEIKRHLDITWSEDDTDNKLLDIMCDAQAELNHILGSEVDYSGPGIFKKLFKEYCLYAWNKCLEEFEEAYRKDIIRARNIIKVRGASIDEEGEV